MFYQSRKKIDTESVCAVSTALTQANLNRRYHYVFMALYFETMSIVLKYNDTLLSAWFFYNFVFESISTIYFLKCTKTSLNCNINFCIFFFQILPISEAALWVISYFVENLKFFTIKCLRGFSIIFSKLRIFSDLK